MKLNKKLRKIDVRKWVKNGEFYRCSKCGHEVTHETAKKFDICPKCYERITL